MVKVCAVKNCGNISCSDVSLHSFPINSRTRQLWIDFCRRGDSWTASKHNSICSAHFQPSQFITQDMQGRRMLKGGANPSIFNPKEVPDEPVHEERISMDSLPCISRNKSDAANKKAQRVSNISLRVAPNEEVVICSPDVIGETTLSKSNLDATAPYEVIRYDVIDKGVQEGCSDVIIASTNELIPNPDVYNKKSRKKVIRGNTDVAFPEVVFCEEVVEHSPGVIDKGSISEEVVSNVEVVTASPDLTSEQMIVDKSKKAAHDRSSNAVSPVTGFNEKMGILRTTLSNRIRGTPSILKGVGRSTKEVKKKKIAVPKDSSKIVECPKCKRSFLRSDFLIHCNYFPTCDRTKIQNPSRSEKKRVSFQEPFHPGKEKPLMQRSDVGKKAVAPLKATDLGTAVTKKHRTLEQVIQEIREKVVTDAEKENIESDTGKQGGKPTGFCRLCAQKKQTLFPIYSKLHEVDIGLEIIIKKHLPCKISPTDKLPLTVCFECSSTLTAFNKLFLDCMLAHKRLTNMLENAICFTLGSEPGSSKAKRRERAKSKRKNEKSAEVKNGIELASRKNKNKTRPIILEISSDEEDADEVSTWSKTKTSQKAVSEIVDVKSTGQEYEGAGPMEILVTSEDEELISGSTPNRILEEGDVESATASITSKTKENRKRTHEAIVQDDAADEDWSPVTLKKRKPIGSYKIDVECPYCKNCFRGNRNMIECPKCKRFFMGKDNIISADEVSDNTETEKEVEAPLKDMSAAAFLKQFTNNEGMNCEEPVEESEDERRASVETDNEGTFSESSETREKNIILSVIGDDHDYSLNEVKMKYNCELCKMFFATKALFVKHSKRHVVCKVCGLVFKYQGRLNTHMASHLTEKSFFCEQCPLSFVTKERLKKHVRIHTTERPFKCDTCQKTYKTRTCLRNHRGNTHWIVEPPYKKRSYLICDICKKQMPNVQLLQRHIEALHSTTSPLFICDRCGQQYKLEKSLKAHLTMGCYKVKDRTCEICQIVCDSVAMKKAHQMRCAADNGDSSQSRPTMAVVKTFPCKVCPKKFCHQKAADIHYIKFHTDLSPYECSHCGLKFVCGKSMKKHVKKHLTTRSRRRRKGAASDSDAVCLLNEDAAGLLQDEPTSTATSPNLKEKTSTKRILENSLEVTDTVSSASAKETRPKRNLETSSVEEDVVAVSTYSTRSKTKVSENRVVETVEFDGGVQSTTVKNEEHALPMLEVRVDEEVNVESTTASVANEIVKNRKQILETSEPGGAEDEDWTLKALRLYKRRWSFDKRVECPYCKHCFRGSRNMIECPKCKRYFMGNDNFIETDYTEIDKASENEKPVPSIEDWSAVAFLEENIKVEEIDCNEQEQNYEDDREYFLDTDNETAMSESSETRENNRKLLGNEQYHGYELNEKEAKYMCELCCLFFANESLLSNHKKCHKVCKVCGMVFSAQSSLTNHMSTHKSENTFFCVKCPLSFVNKIRLKKHIATHSTERPFKCETCQKTFKVRQDLRMHRIRCYEIVDPPMKERNYVVCVTCFRKFSTLEFLKRHIEALHSSARELYICDQCGVQYKLASSLKAHVTMGCYKLKDRTCEICGVVCDSRGVKNRHQQFCAKNKGDSPQSGPALPLVRKNYSCKICSNKFFHQKSADNHYIKFHADRDPYKCHYCGLGFANIVKLKKHIKKHLEERLLRAGVSNSDAACFLYDTNDHNNHIVGLIDNAKSCL